MFASMPETRRLEVVRTTRIEMENLAKNLQTLIASQPPLDLLGWIYGRRILGKPFHQEAIAGGDDNTAPSSGLINDTQFVLEYVHAVLATSTEQKQPNTKLDEMVCAQIFKCASELQQLTMFHAMATSAGTTNNVFGPDTADVEFMAKTTWTLLRGNRYQVLEGEFYSHVLAPHDEALRDAYGVGVAEIASGFQALADALRTGHARAAEILASQMKSAENFAIARGARPQDIVAAWSEENPESLETIKDVLDDMFRGGVCNISKHTKLPAELLGDLSYVRGEEVDFFADGEYAGTPFRTLPVRKKPLIKLNNDFYAVDPCFIRDSGYRALLYNLLQRKKDYRKEFEIRQKAMGEAAFSEILKDQLKGAKVNYEVYYKDPRTQQWVENDTLIRIDDVLILVEAKSGAAATIASPQLDFPRHVQAVKDLVIKAYTQCQRFFDYLNSADEVPIFERKNGKYVKCDQIRLADYRLLLPIGLTVESLSPFSTMCKTLPDIIPLLGRHAFLSISVDDLFVLKRFLTTTGELMHYFDVRQAIGAMKKAFLFDEIDHLGAYIQNNRIDQTISQELEKNNPDLFFLDGMSAIVGRYFEHQDWQIQPVPKQSYPGDISRLLEALNQDRAPGYLRVDTLLRNHGKEGRERLAKTLEQIRKSISKCPNQCFILLGTPALFVWLQRADVSIDKRTVKDKAREVALANNSNEAIGVVAIIDSAGNYIINEIFQVDMQPVQRLIHATDSLATGSSHEQKECNVLLPLSPRKLGRNEKCWCESGIKFKRCHGQ